MARVLFHIDLNAFYASAEELRHPEYKDHPMAVGGNHVRGVLSTANYAARERGVHSAMPVMQAVKICPELILVPGDYDYYRDLSKKFFDYLRTYSKKLEILSVDECFLDVTEEIRQYARPLDMAVQIQQGVLDELGLSCSIGVAPTRFLAKMASDMHKPLGITVLRKSEIPKKLWKLPVREMMGIGKRTVPLLEEKGIHTIEDMTLPEHQDFLKKVLGKSYQEKMDQIYGRSSDQLNFSTTRKSISHARTFGHDIESMDELLYQLSSVARDLSDKMQQRKQMGKIVSVTMRDSSFHNIVRSRQLSQFTNRYEVINETASSILIDHYEPKGYRLLGITVGSLKNEEQISLQPTLFEPAKNTTRSMIDSLNHRLDSPSLMSAADLLKKKKKDKETADQQEIHHQATHSNQGEEKRPSENDSDHPRAENKKQPAAAVADLEKESLL